MAAAPRLPPLYHVGLVVADLEAAGVDFGSRFGLTQERVMDIPVEDALLDGEPRSFSARYGFLQVGGTEVELIQPLEGDSPYSRFLTAAGEGMHHLAFVVDAIDPWIERLRTSSPGFSVHLDARIGERARFVYLAGTAHGALIELVQVFGDG
jgi:catechol 2,3-dioxygenase-like lactoylglutathione lyase family enzyme